ncbi:alpha-xylosidase [Paenibacillus pectinilyticus]|uniref:Alpha-xylosidase n=1 Tax=Paenibacillus pectinilyticus TaxID=512399 RepID=A0A1C1A4M5_9BACL|nr:alpha-xylosidase [Paenibacillus pectinilyticus]OCT15486.1 alpha-xylosidase [Paenibacillus pectinilyticus]
MKDFAFPISNRPIDISKDFTVQENTYFMAAEITQFDSRTATGVVQFRRYARKARICFNQVSMPFEETMPWEFPPEYDHHLSVPIAISFVTNRTVRVRMSARTVRKKQNEGPSLMIPEAVPVDASWEIEESDAFTIYRQRHGSVKVIYAPFQVELRDPNGKLLTKTEQINDTKNLENSEPMPFSIVRRALDFQRRLAASFSLSPDEKIFGCGESFTRLNKRGQKLVLCTSDAFGAQSQEMYKPIPFFMSDKGYGMFVHTSAPLTFDFGNTYDSTNTIFLGDEEMDLFLFLGSPKEILSEYTALTGRSPVPPLWSFGLWMSRITYKSEEEVREVAAKLQEHRIPCDVIHLDTGWFEQDWRCNYQFSKERFEDPEVMIQDMREQGYRLSLWQLPYFTPGNELYQEMIEAGYVVTDSNGNLPTEDAILDFSNPGAVAWYQAHIARLLAKGIGAIKVDFGEAAPIHGHYHSGKSGFYEHNLYPLRYNKAVADMTEAIHGESIIWARSAWAGSQRYPIHWGGDAENTDSAMAASLRAGLSLGLCGFSFWSHDIGGFVQKSPEALYRRWLPFGMLVSHSRCHGAPPKEPWAYSDAFMDAFRLAVEMKYKLLPYIYTQAHMSSEQGFPLVRSLFFEFPQDATSWYIEDEYMLGTDILVAPLMEEGTGRNVYLPAGQWIDYQTGRVYAGAAWHAIEAGVIPIVMLVREGAAILHLKEAALTTNHLDWDRMVCTLYMASEVEEIIQRTFYHPLEEKLYTVEVTQTNGCFQFTEATKQQIQAWDWEIMSGASSK